MTIDTSGGDLIAVGRSHSYGGSDIDGIIVKFNSSGVEQWTKTVGGSDVDVFLSLIETSGGDLVAAGYSQSYGGSDVDNLIVKFNSSGVEQWTKTVGGSNTDYLLSLIETSGGDLIVVGDSQSYGGSDSDGFIAKFNSSGVEQWTKTVGGSSLDYLLSVIETSGGDLIAIGHSQSYGGSDIDGIIVKFNTSGVEQWTKIVGGSSNDYFYSVIEASGGGLVAVGNSQSYGGSDQDGFIARFDSDGNISGTCSGLQTHTVTEANHIVTEANQTVTEADHTPTVTDVCPE